MPTIKAYWYERKGKCQLVLDMLAWMYISSTGVYLRCIDFKWLLLLKRQHNFSFSIFQFIIYLVCVHSCMSILSHLEKYLLLWQSDIRVYVSIDKYFFLFYHLLMAMNYFYIFVIANNTVLGFIDKNRTVVAKSWRRIGRDDKVVDEYIKFYLFNA